jgi:hypothetical protein
MKDHLSTSSLLATMNPTIEWFLVTPKRARSLCPAPPANNAHQTLTLQTSFAKFFEDLDSVRLLI